MSAQGAHQIKYYAKDWLSTEATHTGGWVNIDTVAPGTSDNHLSVPLVNSATISADAQRRDVGRDRRAGQDRVQGRRRRELQHGTSVVLSTLGAHTVAYRSTDKAGNVESPDKTFSVTVRAPLAPVSSTTFASFAPNATSGWQTAGQSVTVSASGGDGVARTIHYTQDGGVNWSTSTAASVTVPVTTQGAHHFEYYASDSLATETVHDAGWVNVDSVAPVTADDHLTAALVTVTWIAVSGVRRSARGIASRAWGPRSGTTSGPSARKDGPYKAWVFNQIGGAGEVGLDGIGTNWFAVIYNGGTPAYHALAKVSPRKWKVKSGDLVAIRTSTRWLVKRRSSGHWKLAASTARRCPGQFALGAAKVLLDIDTRKPLTKAVKASVRKGRKVTLKYRVTDAVPGCGKAALKLQIRKRTKVVKTIALGTKGTNAALTTGTRPSSRRAPTPGACWPRTSPATAATMRSARLVIR